MVQTIDDDLQDDFDRMSINAPTVYSSVPSKMKKITTNRAIISSESHQQQLVTPNRSSANRKPKNDNARKNRQLMQPETMLMTSSKDNSSSQIGQKRAIDNQILQDNAASHHNQPTFPPILHDLPPIPESFPSNSTLPSIPIVSNYDPVSPLFDFDLIHTIAGDMNSNNYYQYYQTHTVADQYQLHQPPINQHLMEHDNSFPFNSDVHLHQLPQDDYPQP